jgi:hypothetical protein
MKIWIIFDVMNFNPKLFIFLCVFIASSCKDKLELNAPYKEMPSIYAVLNPQERKQVIRINKVFLGEGDANEMAKVADSVNYQPGELTVSLTRKFYGKPVDVSPDEPGVSKMIFNEEVITTSAGAFNTTQRVYTTTKSLFKNGEYRLEVKNNKTGNVFTAETSSLDSVVPTGFQPFSEPWYPNIKPGSSLDIPTNYIDYSNQGITYSLRYKPNAAKIYQVRIRIHFYDSIAGSPDNTFHFMDYDFTNQYAKDATTGPPTPGYLATTFRGQDLFNSIGLALSKANLKDATTIYGRKTYKVQFFIFSSTQEYMDYMQYASPSLNISQTKPLYSNFDNKAALGIFTFRSRFTVMKHISNFFTNEFAYNANTRPYKFLLSNNKLP